MPIDPYRNRFSRKCSNTLIRELLFWGSYSSSCKIRGEGRVKLILKARNRDFFTEIGDGARGYADIWGCQNGYALMGGFT